MPISIMANLKSCIKWITPTILMAAAAVTNAGSMIVGDYGANKVVRIDEFTGAYRGVLAQGGGLQGPLGMAYGPDNYLYVASSLSGEIKRYTDTGIFVDNYASVPSPHGLTFYGNDCVVASAAGSIYRFGATPWTSLNSGRNYRSLTVHEGDIYAAFKSSAGPGIERFSAATGGSLGDALPPQSSLPDITGFCWGRDGRINVATGQNAVVYQFDPATQTLLGTIASNNGNPMMVRFTGSGDLLTTNSVSSAVARYSPSTGRFVGNLYGGSALNRPYYMERMNPTIECKITFTDRVNGSMPITSASIEFNYAGSNVSLQSRVVSLAAGGRFNLTTPQFLGRYDLRVKVTPYLGQVVEIDSRDMQHAYANFVLVNGDADGSNVIDAADYSYVERYLGMTSTDSGFDPNADLDGDGTVTTADLGIVMKGFATKGQ